MLSQATMFSSSSLSGAFFVTVACIDATVHTFSCDEVEDNSLHIELLATGGAFAHSDVNAEAQPHGHVEYT